MIGFKIIHDVDGQRVEVYITVAQTQSLYDCLVDKIGDDDNWTKLHVQENGVYALGWGRSAPPGAGTRRVASKPGSTSTSKNCSRGRIARHRRSICRIAAPSSPISECSDRLR